MDNNKEIWKDIEGFNGDYQVSSWGRVKSCERVVMRRDGKPYPIRERILQGIKHKKGYIQVGLYKDGKLTIEKVHRLVAIAFLDNPHGYPEVNHRDEDKTNNRVDNLEYCTQKYNSNFGTRNKRISESLINGKTSKRIYQLSKDNSEIINVWLSAHEVERQMGWNISNISTCAHGKKHTAYNYKWQYADDLMRPFRENL